MGLSDKRWRDWFQDQVDRWTEDNIINSEQRQQILDRYDDNFGPPAILHRNRLIAIIGLLGSLLVGFGIILFIAANWQEIAPFVKVSIIIASIVVFYGLGYLLKIESGDYPRTGEAFLFLGHLTYGASIWLVAQIYHLSSHYPNGFLYWLIGVLAMSLVLKLRTSSILSSVLLGSWVGAELTYLTEYSQSLSISHQFISSPVLLFPILAGFLFWDIYRTRTKTGLFLLLMTIVEWTNYLTIRWAPTVDAEFAPLLIVSILLGAIFYWWGDYEETFGNWPESSVIYRWEAFLVVFGSLYCLTFAEVAEDYLLYSGSFTTLHWVEVLFLGLGVTAIGYYLFSQQPKELQKNIGVETMCILLILGLVILGHGFETTTFVGYVVAINILAFGVTLGFLLKGYFHSQGSLLVAGLIGFGLLLVARYFDLAWELLSRSFFFMSGGVILILGSFLFEFSRRRLLERMEETTQ